MKRLAVLVLGVCTACSLQNTLRLATAEPAPVSPTRPALKPHEIAITWLGSAGALVRGQTQTVAFDPYVTRLNAANTMVGNIRSNHAQVDRYIPPVDLILVGHSHIDHILDVPYLVPLVQTSESTMKRLLCVPPAEFGAENVTEPPPVV